MILRRWGAIVSLVGIFALCWACAAGGALQGSAGTIQRHDDEFRQQSALQLTYDFIALDAVLTGIVGHPEEVMLSFDSNNREWRYLRCHTVDVLVDGSPVPLPQFQHDGSVRAGGVSESVRGHLTSEVLNRIATGTNVRMRLCNTALQFSQDQLVNMRAYIRQLGGTVQASTGRGVRCFTATGDSALVTTGTCAGAGMWDSPRDAGTPAAQGSPMMQ